MLQQLQFLGAVAAFLVEGDIPVSQFNLQLLQFLLQITEPLLHPHPLLLQIIRTAGLGTLLGILAGVAVFENDGLLPPALGLGSLLVNLGFKLPGQGLCLGQPLLLKRIGLTGLLQLKR